MEGGGRARQNEFRESGTCELSGIDSKVDDDSDFVGLDGIPLRHREPGCYGRRGLAKSFAIFR